jgi:hypothetical protein
MPIALPAATVTARRSSTSNQSKVCGIVYAFRIAVIKDIPAD